MDVASWLRSLGLERYETAFRENAVGADVLFDLTGEDLEGLGVAAIGDRRRLLVAIAKLRKGAPRAVRPTNDPIASTSTGERRQLTVMFCDLVGSTALSEKFDPKDTEFAACVSNSLRGSDCALRWVRSPLRR